MSRRSRIELRLAVRAAGFPPATRQHALTQIQQALLVYHEAPVSRVATRGRPRDERLESLLVSLAVQFHVALPTTPGVTKRGECYSGTLVDFARRILDAALDRRAHPRGADTARVAPRNLGRLIYTVIRKRAEIHGDLESYPALTKRPGDGRPGTRRSDWSLPSDVLRARRARRP